MRKPAYGLDSVDNALRLLLMLRRDGSLRVSTAAEELGVVASTAHRLLASLRHRGFVVQDPGRAYRPGPACAELGSAAYVLGLAPLVREHLEALQAEIGETVHLVVRADRRVRFIDGVEGGQVLRVGSRTGMVLPAHRTSGGKALLAALPEDEVAELYGEEFGALRRELAATRRRGYGLNVEESERGVVAVGVPVHDAAGHAVAAVTVAAPTARFRRQELLAVLPALRAAAERIDADLATISAD
jgi:IclR family transcriptional regulator, acetate operon repressor